MIFRFCLILIRASSCPKRIHVFAFIIETNMQRTKQTHTIWTRFLQFNFNWRLNKIFASFQTCLVYFQWVAHQSSILVITWMQRVGVFTCLLWCTCTYTVVKKQSTILSYNLLTVVKPQLRRNVSKPWIQDNKSNRLKSNIESSVTLQCFTIHTIRLTYFETFFWMNTQWGFAHTWRFARHHGS